MSLKAIIFDCDGVLADTERDGHRVAFNEAFRRKRLGVEWSVVDYRQLLQTGGGKERMRSFFDEAGWPPGTVDREELIRELHELKTSSFMELVQSHKILARPGVLRLIDAAIERGKKLAICSTSNEKSVNQIVDVLLGAQRKLHFSHILAGDLVTRKKPDPEIYLLALSKLGIQPAECIVVEDNRNGLLAAKGAGLACLVTYNGYSEDQDFREADLVVPELGDGDDIYITMNTLERLIP